MAITKGFRALLDEAYAAIVTVPVAEALPLVGHQDVQFVDIRDIRELQREGTIPGAFHAPRGMLEFWVDPDSPYFKSVFASGTPLLLFCASGWRSALACKTLQDMGLTDVAHIEGGFNGWRDGGGPVTSA